MKILLVEDTIEIANNICDFARELGFEIDHAENGVDGQRMIRQNEYDLIICDHNMPRASGNEVYDYLREIVKKNTKFIHCSSDPCPEIYAGSDKDSNFVNCQKVHIISLLEKMAKKRKGETSSP